MPCNRSVTPFHHALTGTWSYVVADPSTRQAAVIDPVLDYDWTLRPNRQRSPPTASSSTAARPGSSVRWILETHAHADHLSAAQYLKQQLGGEVAIGQGIRSVQRTFKTIFGLGAGFQPDGSQFDRLLDDDATLPLGAGSIHVIRHARAHQRQRELTSSAMRSSSATRCSCPTAARRAAISRAATLRSCIAPCSGCSRCRRQPACSSATTIRRAAATPVCETTVGEQRARQHAHSRRRRPKQPS